MHKFKTHNNDICRVLHHAKNSDLRISTFENDLGFAKRQHVFTRWHIFDGRPIQDLWLKEHARVVVMDTAEEEALRLGGATRHHHLWCTQRGHGQKNKGH